VRVSLFALCVAFSMGIMVSHARAELPLSKYWEIRGNMPVQVETYLIGLGRGYFYASRITDQIEICVPEGFSPSGATYIGALNDFVSVWSAEQRGTMDVAPAMLAALRQRFPCN
jgi:hypothetical protein